MSGVRDALPLVFALLSGVAIVAFLYGLTLLSRLARGMDDLQDQLDDIRTRLSVLDPGETRLSPRAPEDSRTPAAGNPARAPDETLPGTGSA